MLGTPFRQAPLCACDTFQIFHIKFYSWVEVQPPERVGRLEGWATLEGQKASRGSTHGHLFPAQRKLSL
jgi:hypothetical protein